MSAIPALTISDGSWAAFTGSGDFEIQDPTSFYSSEHWNSYNPFRGSGTRPWATITLADATTLDHVAFTDPDTGVVSDWRIVNTTGHAERFTTAVGEAFFVQNEQKIRMVIEFTPHTAGQVRYVSEPYHGPSRIQQPKTSSVDIVSANTFVDTGLLVPTTEWFYVNFGEQTPDVATAVVNADWTLVNRTQLLAPDEVDPTSLGVTIPTLVRLPDVLGVGNDIYFGHDADDKLYMGTNVAGSEDAYPLSLAEVL